MTLLWFDGFESYYNSNDVDALINLDAYYAEFYASEGRRNSRALRIFTYNDRFYKADAPGTPSTLIFGFAVRGSFWNYAYGFPLLKVYDLFSGGVVHLYFYINSSGLIEVRNSSDTLLGTSSGHGMMLGNTWYYIEVKVYIHDSSGTVTVRLNEAEVLSLTGQDTCNGSNAQVGAVALCSNGTTIYYDDFYMLDTSGTKNNNFLGDVRVDAVRPDGAGTHTDFTPSAGSNYQNVDETYPDDDTTYNDGANVNDQDSYGLPALPSPAATTIFGVKDQITVRKTDAGAMECKLLTVQGGSDYLGDAINLSDTFTTHARIMEDNPDDSADWEDADISGGEIGVEITA